MAEINYSEIIPKLRSCVTDAQMILSLFAYQKDSMLENHTNNIRAKLATESIIENMCEIKSVLEQMKTYQ